MRDGLSGRRAVVHANCVRVGAVFLETLDLLFRNHPEVRVLGICELRDTADVSARYYEGVPWRTRVRVFKRNDVRCLSK